MRLEVAADAALAARVAADLIADALAAALATRGRAALALSGGATPARMLECLATTALPWRGLHVFQVDERFAGPDSPERNLTSLRLALARSSLPADRLHAMPVDAVDPALAAREYAGVLARTLGPEGALDVVHLGLGADGHTASLVPGDAVLESRADVALTGEYQGTRRMTLTFGPLNRARLRLWLVTGEAKREVIARLLDRDPELVATRVRPEASVVVADRAAAPRRSRPAPP